MDLISILIITHLASGQPVQSEIALEHSQCLAASKTLSAAIAGPRKHRPMIEMYNGRMASIIGAVCLPACIPDSLGFEPLELIAKAEDA